MSERRILVTGGAGYIGSHTCKVLAEHGVVPVTYDNLIAGHQDAVRWGPFVPGDILDTGRVAAALAEYRPDAVIHFAAFAYVGESVEDPAKYYRNNVAGALSLLDACRATGVGNIILSSSCATYGIPSTLPISEAEPQHPINPYGRTKLMMEEIVADYAAAYGLRYVALRYFNAAGADPDGELSERHDPETHLIPRALMAASGRIPHLSVFGDDYDTDDGTCVRDYIHVTDLARAHAMATDYLARGGASAAVNLGTGNGISILEILRAIQRITGREVPTVMEPRRPGDPPVLVADPRLARDTLGFSANLSDIDTIVRTAAPTFGLDLLS
ncbi:UDP-glucose 4-epimerase GalE [Microbaculum marinisediminis]|uniref:UDP-glucose 4-epimerase n=1 Tax=Microbaculum marinisediminis TaxID=2931392 RepID=A0AAW5QUQ1_9HYPH|nr:UDP-glucose 4-epimerase GalE [Microbaculum sp. A6E488]MCT8970957.1 UDP-glucose 4-epimerase GalE [Microbaculum sp. A6E488]